MLKIRHGKRKGIRIIREYDEKRGVGGGISFYGH